MPAPGGPGESMRHRSARGNLAFQHLPLFTCLLGSVLLAWLVSWAQLPRPASVSSLLARKITRTEEVLAQARAEYRPGDWESTYHLALVICHLREALTLARTNGNRAEALPETNVLENELQERLNEAARLARTAEQRRTVRHLEVRAFRGLSIPPEPELP